MYNPRFPHKLTVYRASLDELGNPVVDANGDVVYAKVPLSLVYQIDGDPQFNADGSFVTLDPVTEINYGLRTNTRNSQTAGDVATSDFMLACPMFITPLYYGDVLEMTDYDRTFRCLVIKKTNSNWGTNIWCNEIRN